VISSSGIPRLDDAAARMVQQRWKFRPAMKDGKPIVMWRNARVAFQLTQTISGSEGMPRPAIAEG